MKDKKEKKKYLDMISIPPPEMRDFDNKFHNSQESLEPIDVTLFLAQIEAESKTTKKVNIATKALENIVETTENTSDDNTLQRDNYDALELFNANIQDVPTLIKPFFQKVGLASLVGTSDAGKSTFLRQLALSIVLKKEQFCGFPINATLNKVLYVSTEDAPQNVAHSVRKQVLSLINDKSELENIKNLKFIFDTENIFYRIENYIKENPVDLVIIDAFTDVFPGEINSNTLVRQFLNEFDKLAKKNNCLIIFLHHTRKRSQKYSPTKDSVIGSQAFEAKMRSVIEIRPFGSKEDIKHLWVLKSNFLTSEHKTQSYILNFSEDLIYTNTGKRGVKNTSNNKKSKKGKKRVPKSQDPEIIEKVLELHKKGFVTRNIELELKNTEFKVSKTTVNKIINQYEETNG